MTRAENLRTFVGRWGLFAGLSLLFACSGTSQDSSESGGSAGGTLTLGAVLPTTGPNAAVGRECADAVQMAAAEWSPRFKEKGWTLEVDVQDDASDPKQAVAAAYAVTGKPSTFGVVAHYNSGCFLPATEVYHSAGVMAVSPATTNVEITQRGYVEIARVPPHDGIQGQVTAEFVRHRLDVVTVAVIHDRTQYGQGLAEVFREHGQNVGLKITSFDGISVGDKDFRALLTKVRAAAPDAIYFGGLYDEAGFLVKQARELGIASLFVSDDAVKGQDFFDVGGAATEGAIISFPGTPLERLDSAKNFLSSFQAKYGRPVQNYAPYAYDTANILLNAAYEAVKEGRPDDLRGAVVSHTRATQHQGTLGVTKFDLNGDTLNRKYSFYRVVDGAFEYMETVLLGAAGQAQEEAGEAAPVQATETPSTTGDAAASPADPSTPPSTAPAGTD
ncbi:MAG TPA: hypothetical protein DIU15_17540 [Deltaproteobacteria bacterium]|nr:hypothetical protein [Deltaproteobacteria bacterium]HCP47848.1 hypothetical protein [Deltaproteobacteria bacterium]